MTIPIYVYRLATAVGISLNGSEFRGKAPGLQESDCPEQWTTLNNATPCLVHLIHVKKYLFVFVSLDGIYHKRIWICFTNQNSLWTLTIVRSIYLLRHQNFSALKCSVRRAERVIKIINLSLHLIVILCHTSACDMVIGSIHSLRFLLSADIPQKTHNITSGRLAI